METDYQAAVQSNLTMALIKCAKVLRQWHGEEAFDIYYKHSPEMALVREALPYEDFEIHCDDV